MKNDIPIKEGYYWFKQINCELTMCKIYDDGWCCFMGNDTPFKVLELKGIFYGPILPPN